MIQTFPRNLIYFFFFFFCPYPTRIYLWSYHKHTDRQTHPKHNFLSEGDNHFFILKDCPPFIRSLAIPSIQHRGAGRIGPLPNRPSANRPPKKVGPGQIGPLKIWPWTNRPPVENFCNLNLFKPSKC